MVYLDLVMQTGLGGSVHTHGLMGPNGSALPVNSLRQCSPRHREQLPHLLTDLISD